MTGEKAVIPMCVWLAVGIIILILLFISCLVLNLSNQHYLAAYFNHRRLAQNAGKVNNAPLIVVMGSSMLYKALYFDKMMERTAVQNGSQEFNFIRFVIPCGKLEDFVVLLPEIVKARPAVVYMEANLFLLDFDKPCHNFRKANHQYELRLFIRQLLGLKNIYNFGDTSTQVMDADKREGQADGIGTKKYTLKMYKKFYAGVRLRRFGLSQEYATFIRDLKAQGSDLILLQIPRSVQAQSVFPDLLEQSCRRLLDKYQKSFSIPYQAFPSLLSKEYYSDYSHLNMKGKALYSQWFISQADSLLRLRSKP